MDVADKVRSRFEKSLKQAKKYYTQGDLGKARLEYANCARQLRYLAGLSPSERREELLAQSKQFQEIADSLGPVPGRKEKPAEGVAGAAQTESGMVQTQQLVGSGILAEKPGVRFADIADMEEVKESIKEAIIYPFIYPEEYQHFGVRPGGGLLLYGPPGCGKTMVAAATAAESDALFFNLKVSDIKNKYVGESERKVREVFVLARQHARSVVFFDEIDALASERSSSMEVYERSLVSELLAQMDGLQSEASKGHMLVLAASNRPWDIDLALRRSGRFDTTIFVPHPSLTARRKILELSLQDKPVASSVGLDRLARTTAGYSSAEIVDICQRAAKIPLRERITQKKPRRELTLSDFEQVVQRKRTILSSWYAKATAQLAVTQELDMFGELLEAAEKYVSESRQARSTGLQSE